VPWHDSRARTLDRRFESFPCRHDIIKKRLGSARRSGVLGALAEPFDESSNLVNVGNPEFGTNGSAADFHGDRAPRRSESP